MFQIFLCLLRLGVLEVQIAGAECRRHVGLNAAVLTGIVRTLSFALHQFVLVHVYFGRAPPYVVERAVADHIDNVVTLIAAHQIIQCKLEVVLIHGTLTSLFHTVAVVQQTPAQQCCGVRIGQCEFQVISGIKPAACHIVVGHAVRTPADFVPVRLFAALLHLVEKHRLLESLSIVVLAVAVSSGYRCRRNCRSHSGHCQHCGRNRRDPLLHRQSILPFQKRSCSYRQKIVQLFLLYHILREMSRFFVQLVKINVKKLDCTSYAHALCGVVIVLSPCAAKNF